MIVAENQVVVPGKKYRVKVSCVSTRRLTTIEWILLRCTCEFSGDKTTKIKDVFEQVFQFQNSELLIKPCLKNLEDLNVIKITSTNSYDYSSLCFSSIKLTELGQLMLDEGLLPGEPRDIPMDIYYNPLTGKVYTADAQVGAKGGGIEFGTESDYDMTFPEEKIIKGLQTGAVASGQFTAAKYRIESIDNMETFDWESSTDIAIDLGEDGILKTIPDIVESTVYNKVRMLLMSREISEKVLNNAPSLSDVKVRTVLGSGKNIKKAIQSICANAKVILIHSDVYNAYKRNTTFFKGKIVIVYGSNHDFYIERKKESKNELTRFVFINQDFPVNGVVLINEKEESISLCKGNWEFKGVHINAPVIVEDRRMNPKGHTVRKWLKDLITNCFTKEMSFLAFASLPGSGMRQNTKQLLKLLEDHWTGCEFDDIASETKRFMYICKQLDLIPMDISSLSSQWEEKMDSEHPEIALDQFNRAIDAGLLLKGSPHYIELAKSVVRRIDSPTSYSEYISLMQKLGVGSYEDAFLLTEVESSLYTTSVVEDILRLLVLNKKTTLPSFFDWDVFFNDYISDINYIEAHISNLDIFTRKDVGELRKAMDLCPNISSLQMYVSKVISKHEHLMSCGINVFDVMATADQDRAYAFSSNIKNITAELNHIISAEYDALQVNSLVRKDEMAKQKVYVLDTCALIHNPRILLSFADDEYVRIPTKVIDEIGKIKDRRDNKYDYEASNIARTLVRDINDVYLGLFNVDNKIRLLIENADLSLLPNDLDPDVPDNQILAVALKYSNCDTTIISDDTVFLLTAISQNIKSMTSEEFLESHIGTSKSLEHWKNTVRILKPVKISKSLIMEKSNRTPSEYTGIDAIPVRELGKYTADLTNPVISFLNSNNIKTVGQFRQLTAEQVDFFKAKGSQVVYRNTIKHVLKRIGQIIDKLEADQNGENNI